MIPGAAVPALIGIVGQKSRESWQILFLLSAAIIIVMLTFYVITIRPDVQDFDHQADVQAIDPIQDQGNDVPEVIIHKQEDNLTANWPLDDAALTMLWSEDPQAMLQEAEGLRYLLKLSMDKAKEQ